MLDVHHKGRAVVSSGARERMEYDASRLHGYGLWATVEQPRRPRDHVPPDGRQCVARFAPTRPGCCASAYPSWPGC